MQVIEFLKYDVRNDDGSHLDPETRDKVHQLMLTFIEAKVLGETSPVNRRAALRMAEAVMRNYVIIRRGGAVPSFDDEP